MVCKVYEFIADLTDRLEAPPGFEPGHKGFAARQGQILGDFYPKKLKLSLSFLKNLT